jgi:hypothetical protein
MIHGSDTGIYDKAGKFSLERFNDIFDMFTAPPHTHIKFWEIVKMLNADRNPFDLVSRSLNEAILLHNILPLVWVSWSNGGVVYRVDSSSEGWGGRD